MEVHFTPELEKKLNDLAAQTGRGPEEIVQDLVADAVDLKLRDTGQPPPKHRHISEVIRENMRKVPPEIMATMPRDGASQHDHYIYGWPKREQ